MIIKLSKFKDLGKCSMGTMLDTYDTEKNHIFIKVKEIETITDFQKSFAEVKINSAEDLCKWLWCIAGISHGNNKNEQCWYFSACSEWWHGEFDKSIVRYDTEAEKIKKKLQKETNEKKIARLKNNLKFYDSTDLKNMIADHETRMKEITEEIIKENS